jgi:uncharacterized metal-binding protein YceD (DUF177 family)
MTSILNWTHETADVGEHGKSETRSATADERAHLVTALELLGCDALTATYEIRLLREGIFRLTGTFTADVTQACVVTLEPVAGHIEEGFAVEFWPADQVKRAAEGERAVLSGDDIEPIEGGRIDVGRIVFEHLSAALDPYPRKSGAVLEWHEPESGASEPKPGPFAALAKLKPKAKK